MRMRTCERQQSTNSLAFLRRILVGSSLLTFSVSPSYSFSITIALARSLFARLILTNPTSQFKDTNSFLTMSITPSLDPSFFPFPCPSLPATFQYSSRLVKAHSFRTQSCFLKSDSKVFESSCRAMTSTLDFSSMSKIAVVCD